MRSFPSKTTIVAAALLFAAGTAWADNEKSPSEMSETNQGAGASRKLGRGIANLAGGWLEFPKGIQSVGDESGFLAGLTWGTIYGLGNAVVRTGVGAYEIVTFPIPKYDPVIQPEFVLQ
jgi:putative exosortase-associated protein (TIGR04073 family)